MSGLMSSVRQKGVDLAGLEVRIRTPSTRDAEALAALLCRDSVLRQSLGIPEADRPTAASFLDKIDRWCEQTNSVTMAVLDADSRAIGTISLSNVNEEDRTGGIGYWLASDCWGQGYASQAFALTMWLARTLDIHRVFAHVARDNTASRRIWRRYQAVEDPGGGDMLKCWIDLHNTSPAYARLLATLREIGYPLAGGDETDDA